MPAKHIKARHWIETGIFNALPSFTDLEQRINAITEEKDRGDVFEIFVEGFLATQPTMQCVNHWVVGDIPLTLRQQYNLPSDAKGIDGVYESRLGTHVAYCQRRCYKSSNHRTEKSSTHRVTMSLHRSSRRRRDGCCERRTS